MTYITIIANNNINCGWDNNNNNNNNNKSLHDIIGTITEHDDEPD
jgi:hypothetical protein